MIARRAAAALVALLALAAAAPGGGLENCGFGAGECDEVHPTPGCDFFPCCATVCELVPECCEIEWDAFCVELQAKFCDPPVCPGEGGCSVPNETPGCDDELCCELVCEIDPFCCLAAWDPLCADRALRLCVASQCEVDPPVGALDEAEPCGERLNDGCNMSTPSFAPLACGASVAGVSWASTTRDTDWYEIEICAPTTLSWTVEAEFPAVARIIQGGCGVEGYQVIAQAWGDSCLPATASIDVEPGIYRLFVAPGDAAGEIFNGIPCPATPEEGGGVAGQPFTNRYVATLGCTGCPECPWDLVEDELVNVLDLIFVLGEWAQPGSPADVDGNGDVDVLDLLQVLSNWGACP